MQLSSVYNAAPTSYKRVCIGSAIAKKAAIAKLVSVIQLDLSFACLAAMAHCIKFVTSIFPVPFAHYYNYAGKLYPNEGIPMLRPTQGFRKLLTTCIHVIALFRAGWLLFVLNGNVKVSHNGLLTSDFCFISTIYLTTVAVFVVWFKTWRYSGVFCWLHNSYDEMNRKFSGNHSHSSTLNMDIPVRLLEVTFNISCRALLWRAEHTAGG